MRILIPLPPRTKKNSQRLIVNKRTGRPMILPSKAYTDYKNSCAPFLRPTGIDYPVNVKAVYYMATRHKVDLINLHEALHDILVDYGVLADDNSKIIVSTDGSRVEYDKDNPRTEVEIERREEGDGTDINVATTTRR